MRIRHLSLTFMQNGERVEKACWGTGHCSLIDQDIPKKRTPGICNLNSKPAKVEV